MINRHPLLWIACLGAAALPLRAETAAPAEPSPTEARLREALRNTMLQLRTAQEESAALQAKLAESEAGKTAAQEQVVSLTAKLGELAKKSASEKEASAKSMEGLQAQMAARDAQIAKLNEALEKWKQGYGLAVKALQEKETERAVAAEEILVLQRKVEERESHNLALFKLGNEILTRYKKFSLGDALTAKEPFTGITRSRLEELVQDYRHKLQDEKLKPANPEGGMPASPGVARAP